MVQTPAKPARYNRRDVNRLIAGDAQLHGAMQGSSACCLLRPIPRGPRSCLSLLGPRLEEECFEVGKTCFSRLTDAEILVALDNQGVDGPTWATW